MSLLVNINSNNTKVTLDLSLIGNTDEISYKALIAALKDNNIPIDAWADKNIRIVLESLAGADIYTDSVVLIRATPTIPGKDGFFEWSEKFDPEKRKIAEDDRENNDRLNFYEQSSLITVKKGDILGILHPATDGEPGKDVFDNPIPPTPGIECKINPGKNVEVLSDGMTFVAQCDGVPKMDGETLSVDPILEVNSDIDFGIGNIDYSGDICINGDVIDLFTVRAGGDM